MRSKERTKDGVAIDTTKRLKKAHRDCNAIRVMKGNVPLSLREFAKSVDSSQWKKDKHATDHPKRARSKATIETRRMARLGRKKGGGSKKPAPSKDSE